MWQAKFKTEVTLWETIHKAARVLRTVCLVSGQNELTFNTAEKNTAKIKKSTGK